LTAVGLEERGEQIVRRRTALKGMGCSLMLACTRTAPGSTGFGDNTESFHPRIWDIHSHLGNLPGDTAELRMEALVRFMDRIGVERVILSQGFDQYVEHPSPDQVREENDRVMRAVKRFPDRAYGSVYLSPDHVDFGLQEFDRCVRDGR
jgi:predicted TIM-barrel fold metal-dependent hydrolase